MLRLNDVNMNIIEGRNPLTMKVYTDQQLAWLKELDKSNRQKTLTFKIEKRNEK